MNEGPLRIAVYGPESTGKTQLARKLAAHFRAPLVEAWVRPVSGAEPARNGAWNIETDTPVWAVAPGQACALYNGDVCLGGGRIVEPAGGAGGEREEQLRPREFRRPREFFFQIQWVPRRDSRDIGRFVRPPDFENILLLLDRLRGHVLAVEAQRAKLRLVIETAGEVWGSA